MPPLPPLSNANISSSQPWTPSLAHLRTGWRGGEERRGNTRADAVRRRATGGQRAGGSAGGGGRREAATEGSRPAHRLRYPCSAPAFNPHTRPPARPPVLSVSSVWSSRSFGNPPSPSRPVIFSGHLPPFLTCISGDCASFSSLLISHSDACNPETYTRLMMIFFCSSQ